MLLMSSKRREKILKLLEKKESVYLKELEKVFPDVSSMTLRRDFDYLVSMGIAIKIKGGLRLLKSVTSDRREDIYDHRLNKNIDQKDGISRLATEYIETGRSIFIDSGSTALSLAKALPDTNLFILTSDPHIALEVMKNYSPTVNIIGGLLNRTTLSVSGIQSINFIKDYNFDVAFLVPSAFSVEHGCSCGNYSECELKKNIINRAKLRILLVDSSKFEKSMPFTFASFDDFDILITDKKPAEAVLEKAKEHNVVVKW